MSESNVFSQSFDDLIRNVGAKIENETVASNVEAPKTEAPKTDDYKVDVDVFGQQAAVDPVNATAAVKDEEKPAKQPEPKADVFSQSFEDLVHDAGAKAQNETATSDAKAPKPEALVFEQQTAADDTAEKDKEKPVKQPEPKADVLDEPVVKENKASEKKPAKRVHRKAKKTEPVSKDAMTITVPLNSKVTALLDDDKLSEIEEHAKAAITAEIKAAVKAAAEALINDL